MKINLQKAIKAFHPNPSFEQVYYEAVANSIDAGATDIKISIRINSYDSPDTLRITIEDNGKGFTDLNFQRFSSLLEVDGDDHKGLGRLIYLHYFSEIQFESHFDGNKRRRFIFTPSFTGDSQVEPFDSQSGIVSEFKAFSGDKIKSYAYLIPEKIKESLVEHFFPLLFNKKKAGENLEITLSLDVKEPNPEQGFFSGSTKLTLNDLPVLKECRIQNTNLDFFQSIDIRYSVTRDLTKNKSVRTSICVDGRAVDWDLLSLEAVPSGYQLVFLFSSDYFIGKTNSSRQKLELPDEVTEKTLKTTLRREIGRIVAEEIPKVVEENKKTVNELNTKFPHLVGYYPKEEPGLIIKTSALEEAQKSFFNEQKKLLECESLDDSNYQKAVELSARALMEYVLYRARIIERLKTMNPAAGEDEIHSLIVPMRRKFDGDNFHEDIYNNNVWMLDDKYMSYNTVLSDQSMTEVVKHIALDEIKDVKRPDITLVFSSDPTKSEKVSVVVVELKKHGVELAKKEEVVSQLRQRARKLLNYFPDKIERIWFYGVTDIDKDFRRSLKEDQFKELFSHGQVFYKPQPIFVNEEGPEFLVDLFVMTYDALINDAETRNATFVRILKARIASFVSGLEATGLLPEEPNVSP